MGHCMSKNTIETDVSMAEGMRCDTTGDSVLSTSRGDLSSTANSNKEPSLRYMNTRRASISSEVQKMSLSLYRGKQKSPETRRRVNSIISKIVLFQMLDEEQKKLLVEAMEPRECNSGDVIIAEGDEGDFFYAIDYGVFTASVRQEVKYTYNNVGYFGELALMYCSHRAATVTCLGPGRLWALDRITFRALIVGNMKRRREKYQNILLSTHAFKGLATEQLAAMADSLVPENFSKGTVIISEGDAITDASKFYVIEKGEVECYRINDFSKKSSLISKMGPGDIFGEIAFITNNNRQADCIASTEVKCLTLSRDAFNRLTGGFKEILAHQVHKYNEINAD